MDERLLTVSDVAKILNVSPNSLYNRVQREKYGLIDVRLGETRTLRFRRSNVLEIITRGMQPLEATADVA